MAKNGKRLEHRGRFQAQGKTLEESRPWSQNVPITKVDGIFKINDLESSLPERDRSIRMKAFENGRRFINSVAKVGISPIKKTFKSRPQDGEERVDVEVNSGCAFTG